MRVLISSLLLALPVLAGDLAFRTQEISNELRGGYQVVIADVNRDGKPDIIALASGMDDLVWFENPTWTRHVLAQGLKRMINCVMIGDEIVVAHGFENEAYKSTGNVSVLRRGPNFGQPWSGTEIDKLPTSHRLRVAVIGGEKVVVNAPLTGIAAAAPDYKDKAPLVFYRPGKWKRETIPSENFGVQHGIFIDGDSILTASFSGIHRFIPKKGGWKRVEISKGDPAPCPKCGTSDVAVAADGRIVAIEPWHGNQVVEYFEGKRTVIDNSLTDGHSIATADFDGDGIDEIVVAQRGTPGRVIIYKQKDRIVIDQGMAAASCTPADLNADGRMDLVCIGSATHNLKIYWK